MTDQSERAVLNHLIETCKDAERGFRHVAEYANDQTVKSLFLDIASQRARFAADLLPHAQRLGGAREAEGSAAGGPPPPPGGPRPAPCEGHPSAHRPHG